MYWHECSLIDSNWDDRFHYMDVTVNDYFADDTNILFFESYSLKTLSFVSISIFPSVTVGFGQRNLVHHPKI